MNEMLNHPIRHLPLRQKQVLVALVEGKERKEVASELGLSVKTIDDHVMRIGRRLGSTNLAMLTRFALKLGFTTLCFLFLCLQSRGGSSITVAWNVVTNAEVSGYKAKWGVTTINYTNYIAVAGRTNTSVLVTGLVEGTTYYFAASSTNILGLESTNSIEASYLVPYGRPPAPTGLHVVP